MVCFFRPDKLHYDRVMSVILWKMCADCDKRIWTKNIQSFLNVQSVTEYEGGAKVFCQKKTIFFTTITWWSPFLKSHYLLFSMVHSIGFMHENCSCSFCTQPQRSLTEEWQKGHTGNGTGLWHFYPSFTNENVMPFQPLGKLVCWDIAYLCNHW